MARRTPRPNAGRARPLRSPRPRRRPTRAEILDLPSDPLESAEEAGLRYVSDASPGIRRRRAGRGFTYLGVDGTRISYERQLERIRALAIPPAWTDVWISPTRRGHIQATGRDARKRKQYRYHPRWHAVRDEVKYGRMVAFGAALPGTPEFREALRLALLSEKDIAASQAVFNFTETNRYGVDDRARVLITVKDGNFALLE